jgi:hypothetical protein
MNPHQKSFIHTGYDHAQARLTYKDWRSPSVCTTWKLAVESWLIRASYNHSAPKSHIYDTIEDRFYSYEELSDMFSIALEYGGYPR